MRELSSFSCDKIAISDKDYRYERLGYGWTSSILGIIALCIGLTGVIFLWKFGHVLREKSPYCASRDVDDC